MPPPPATPPTDAELEVLHVLWERGASTVREVFEVIAQSKDVQYTTVLKQLQVMYRKGLVVRSERFRSHVYEAARARQRTEHLLVTSLLDKVFHGSARSLLQSALAGRRVDARELDEIAALLEEYRKKGSRK